MTPAVPAAGPAAFPHTSEKARLTVSLNEHATDEEISEIVAAVATLHEDLAGEPIEDLLIVRPDRWTLWIEGPVPILPPRKPHIA